MNAPGSCSVVWLSMALALLALAPAAAEASVSHAGALAGASRDAALPRSLGHELAPSTLAFPESARSFELFAGDELARVLAHDARAADALELEPGTVGEHALAPLALASRVRELRLNLHQDLSLLGLEPLRGPPELGEDLCQGHEGCIAGTRIGGLELEGPLFAAEKPALSFGLLQACSISSCGLAYGKPLDPLGLCPTCGLTIGMAQDPAGTVNSLVTSVKDGLAAPFRKLEAWRQGNLKDRGRLDAAKARLMGPMPTSDDPLEQARQYVNWRIQAFESAQQIVDGAPSGSLAGRAAGEIESEFTVDLLLPAVEFGAAGRAGRVSPPLNDYDVAAWEAFYAENPGYLRSVGAAGGKGAAAANLAKNRAAGKVGEVMSTAEAVTAGETVRGSQITFELPSGKRTVSDLLTEKPGVGLKVREAKKGPGARLSDGQLEMQQTTAAGGVVTPRGKRAAKAGLTPGKPVNIKDFEEDRFP